MYIIINISFINFNIFNKLFKFNKKYFYYKIRIIINIIY